MRKIQLMIDLETLGSEPDAVVLSLGAVLFTPEEGIIKEFYTIFNPEEQLKRKRSVKWDVLTWWLVEQKTFTKLADEINSLPPCSVEYSLKEFLLWCNEYIKVKGKLHKFHDRHRICPWGNGSTFDISMLENLLRQYNKTIPWNFWDVRDMRTFREYVGKGLPVEKSGEKHNALDDAVAQAKYVITHLDRSPKEQQNGYGETKGVEDQP